MAVQVSQAATTKPASETALENGLSKEASLQPQQLDSPPAAITTQQQRQQPKDAPPAFAAPQASDDDDGDAVAAWEQQPASLTDQVLQGGQKKQSGGLHADAPEFKPRPSGSVGSAYADSP